MGSNLDRKELLAAASAERAGLGRTIQYAPADSWEQPSACPGWWNRDVIAHLAAQDTAAAQILADEAPSEIDEYRKRLGGDELTVDGFNAFAVNNRAPLPYRQVLSDWGRAADAVLAFASTLTDEEWRTRRFPWLAGEIAAHYLLQLRVVEWWVHGEDVRSGAGMESRVVHPPMFLTNDLAIRMLPWALSRAGIDLPGRSVRLDLEGAGGGSWHWSLEPGRVPDEDEKPDAFIEGRAHAFAIVAARRAPAGDYLDDGNLVVGGEEELAFTVLEHIRAYP
jgi:uncharacterized protein (TIGR03083 family)